MKKTSQHLIAEVPRRQSRAETTIGIDLGDVWSYYCTLNEAGEVVDRGRFRTSPKGLEKWFTGVPPARVAMEAGTHSIWVSEQLQELGHEVIVANVRELRAISQSDRKSDQVDAEKLARYARLDPNILRPISHRTVEQQEALTLIRARDLLVRLRTAAVNAVRGLTKSCGYRMPASSTPCFAKRSEAVMPPGLAQALGPVLEQIAEMTVKIKQYDRQIQLLTQTEYPETQALLKVQGVGHITALTYVLTLEVVKSAFSRAATSAATSAYAHDAASQVIAILSLASSRRATYTSEVCSSSARTTSLDLMAGTLRFDSGDYTWRLEVASRPGTRPSLRSRVSWPSCCIAYGPRNSPICHSTQQLER